jgi:hypothetical protein
MKKNEDEELISKFLQDSIFYKETAMKYCEILEFKDFFGRELYPVLKKQSVLEKEIYSDLINKNEFFRDYKSPDFDVQKFRLYTQFFCTLYNNFLFVKEEYLVGEENPLTYRYYLYKLPERKLF